MFKRLLVDVGGSALLMAGLLFAFTYLFNPDGLKKLDSYIPGILAFTTALLVWRYVQLRKKSKQQDK